MNDKGYDNGALNEAPQEGLRDADKLAQNQAADIQAEKLATIIESSPKNSDNEEEQIPAVRNILLDRLEEHDPEKIKKHQRDDITDEELDEIFGSKFDIDLEELIEDRNTLLSEVKSFKSKRRQAQAIRILQKLYATDRERFNQIRDKIFDRISKNTKYFSSAEELELLNFIREGMPTKATYDFMSPFTVYNEQGKRVFWPKILEVRKAKIRGTKILFDERYKDLIDAGGHFQPESSKNRISNAPSTDFETLVNFIASGNYTRQGQVVLHEVSHQQQRKASKNAFSEENSVAEVHAERAARSPSNRSFTDRSAYELARSIAGLGSNPENPNEMIGTKSPHTGRSMYTIEPDNFTETIINIDTLYALGATESQIWETFKGTNDHYDITINLQKLIKDIAKERNISIADLSNLRTAWRLESQIDRMNVSRITSDVVFAEAGDLVPRVDEQTLSFNPEAIDSLTIDLNKQADAWEFAQTLTESPKRPNSPLEDISGTLTNENYSELYLDKFNQAVDLEYLIPVQAKLINQSLQEATEYLKQLNDLYQKSLIGPEEYEQKSIAVHDSINTVKSQFDSNEKKSSELKAQLKQIKEFAEQGNLPSSDEILPSIDLDGSPTSMFAFASEIYTSRIDWMEDRKYQDAERETWIFGLKKDTDNFISEMLQNNPDIIPIDIQDEYKLPEAKIDFDIPRISEIEINCAVYSIEHLPSIIEAAKRNQLIRKFMDDNTNAFQFDSSRYITQNLDKILRPYTYIRPDRWEMILSNPQFTDYVSAKYGPQRLEEIRSLLQESAS